MLIFRHLSAEGGSSPYDHSKVAITQENAERPSEWSVYSLLSREVSWLGERVGKVGRGKKCGGPQGVSGQGVGHGQRQSPNSAPVKELAQKDPLGPPRCYTRYGNQSSLTPRRPLAASLSLQDTVVTISALQ